MSESLKLFVFLCTNKTAGLHNKYYVYNVQYSFHYSRRLADLREASYQFVYLDETWVNVNHQPSKEWSSDSSKVAGRTTPIGTGQRIIILHAGGEDRCVFCSVHLDGRDYHSEVNATIFEDWLLNRLLPCLQQPTCIVMDNASYHSTIQADQKNQHQQL